MKTLNQRTYSLSFTTCGLRVQECLKIAKLYLKHKDWSLVRNQVIEENILRQRTLSSSKKLYRELASRLKLLSNSEITYLVNCAEQEKPYLLWVAACRRYDFIRDFAVEVLREHYFNLHRQLQRTDFIAFFNSKLSVHAELENISASTKRKISQVIFRMLIEAGLVSSDLCINFASPSYEMLWLLETSSPDYSYIFPSSASAIV